MPMIIKYRVVGPYGTFESEDPREAQVWRDKNAPGKSIAIIEEQMPPSQAAIDAAWKAANDLAYTYADENERGKYLYWLIMPQVPDRAKMMIIEVNQAMDAIWMYYFQIKAEIIAGNPYVTFDPTKCPACPWTFAEISQATMG